MNELCKVSVIKQILLQHDMRPCKRMGQNFLINPGICAKIANSCGAGSQSGILEIGPGIGTLTCELASIAKKVVAIELDKKLIPVLGETLQKFNNIKVIQGDAIKINIAEIIKQEFSGMDVYVCANLPYYITSPLVMRFLEERLPVKTLTFMLQKEAAQRICAAPASKHVGAISFAVRYYSEPSILFKVSKGSFYPAPKVDSCVIQLKIKQNTELSGENEQLYFNVIKAAFAQRRKNVVGSVAHGLGVTKEQAAAILTGKTGRLPKKPEEISIEAFK